MRKIKSCFNIIAKKHILSTIVAIVIVVILYCKLNNGLGTNGILISVLSSTLSGWIMVGSGIILLAVERHIRRVCEDNEKLTTDYKSLCSKYEKENLLQIEKENNIVFPISIIAKALDCPIDEKHIQIFDDSSKHYELPIEIATHFESIMQAHKMSTIYNSDCIRVDNFKIKDGIIQINTSRTSYFNSMATNRSMDWKFMSVSCRELFEYNEKLTSLEESKLSNHLGFNAFVETCDHFFLFTKRKGNMSIGKYTYGSSIGASLKTKKALNEKNILTVNGLKQAIIGEAKDELSINESQIIMDSIRIIGAYRDCVEGGKPQLLVYFKVTDSKDTIERNFKNYKAKQSKVSFKDRIIGTFNTRVGKTLRDCNKIVWIHKDEFIQENICILPEKISASCISKNRAKKINMRTLPSTSGSAVMLSQFLKMKELETRN